MSDSVKLDFADFLAGLDLAPSTPAGLAAAEDLEDAQTLLKGALAQLQECQPEERVFAAVEVALSGIRLNDRKLRLLAHVVRAALDGRQG